MRAALVLASLAVAGPAGAGIRQFSYDPANSATFAASGPLTVVVDWHMFSSRVLKIRSTEAQATADLKPADPGVLGRGGLRRLTGPDSDERNFYQVLASDEGGELTAALCPGSKRAWLAIGRVKPNLDLHMEVVGDDPAGGPPRACRALDFHYHGEWRVPAGALPRPAPMGPPGFPNH
jgi:hypothetical protein